MRWGKWKDFLEFSKSCGVDIELPKKEIAGVAETLCFWSDAIGFGKKCVEFQWDLLRMYEAGIFIALQWYWLDMRQMSPVERFEEYVQGLNDGVVAGIDIQVNSLEKQAGIFQYIHHKCVQHWLFNDLVVDTGMPGVLTVCAKGTRLTFKDGEMHVRQTQSLPSAFEMNSAFSQAYVIEESGRLWGSEVNSVYLTEEVVHLLQSISNCNEDSHSIEDTEDIHLGYIYEFHNEPVYGVSLTLYCRPISVKNKLFETRLYRVKYSSQWNDLTDEDVVCFD